MEYGRVFALFLIIPVTCVYPCWSTSETSNSFTQKAESLFQGADQCKYGGMYDKATGRCDCRDIACPYSLHPVCGSDGRQYPDECTMRTVACMTQQDIHSVGFPPCDPSDTESAADHRSHYSKQAQSEPADSRAESAADHRSQYSKQAQSEPADSRAETATDHGHHYSEQAQSESAESADPIGEYCKSEEAKVISSSDPIGEYCKSEEAKVISSSDIFRLNFAGRFLADVSTYNNEPTNYNTDTFDPQRAPSWNPKGTNDFRLVNCTVTQVCFADGTCSTSDTTVGKRIIGSDSTITGKLVDLDTEDQTQSQIWGLQVGVDGFFTGDFTPRSFNHMHDACEGLACPTVSGMTRFSAVFFSTLENVKSINSQDSEFMRQVKSLSCMDGFKLHIKLNVYNMIVVSESPEFPYGRVTGTIFAKLSDTPRPYGPYNRMLWGPPNKGGGHVPFYVEIKERNKVVLDFANFLKFDIKGNVVGPSGGPLYLTQYSGERPRGCKRMKETILGYINLGGNDWFQRTAGIVEVSVTPEAFENIENTQKDIENTHLAVIKQTTPTHCEILVEERQDGLFVQAIDDRVARKEPGKEWQMQFRTFRFGSPTDGVFIRLEVPENRNEDYSKLDISSDESGSDGITSIKFTSEDPGEPRHKRQLDGDVYEYNILAKKGDDETEFKVLDLYVTVHLYSQYSFTEGEVTWYEHVYPIFQRYANLYPSMKPIINLASYEDVTRKRKLLKHALKLPETDPNHMPVTRDLSPEKRKMILSWLKDEHKDPITKLPKLGTATDTLDELKKTLQIALQLELSTIPPYLSALFSIKDGDNKEVAALIRSVVVDEMKHMALVSNILNAIGGAPNLKKRSIVPSYPAPLPGGCNPSLVLKLEKCSLNQIRTVFQGIERPNCEMVDSDVFKYLRINKKRLMGHSSDEPGSKTSLQDIDELCQKMKMTSTRPQTIGAIYIYQILCPLAKLELEEYKKGDTLFKEDTTEKQITDEQWFGTEDDSPSAVSDFDSAVAAIITIAAEGEGSDPCHPFDEKTKDEESDPNHPFDDNDNDDDDDNDNDDDDDNDDEKTNKLSHFSKFAEVVHGRKLMETGPHDEKLGSYFENFTPCDEEVKSCEKTFGFVGRTVPFFEDGVWPTISNPHTKSYPPGSQARKYSENFNMVYTGLLKCLHEAFNGAPDKLKNDCMGMMSSLTAWGKRLVQTPIDPNGDPEIGPNAAPTFQFYEPSD